MTESNSAGNVKEWMRPSGSTTVPVHLRLDEKIASTSTTNCIYRGIDCGRPSIMKTNWASTRFTTTFVNNPFEHKCDVYDRLWFLRSLKLTTDKHLLLLKKYASFWRYPCRIGPEILLKWHLRFVTWTLSATYICFEYTTRCWIALSKDLTQCAYIRPTNYNCWPSARPGTTILPGRRILPFRWRNTHTYFFHKHIKSRFLSSRPQSYRSLGGLKSDSPLSTWKILKREAKKYCQQYNQLNLNIKWKIEFHHIIFQSLPTSEYQTMLIPAAFAMRYWIHYAIM